MEAAYCRGMGKPLFDPMSGLIQDVLLLSSLTLLFAAAFMAAGLRIMDLVSDRKRRKLAGSLAGLRELRRRLA